MPSLPKKNTLDYNPDSVFNASKFIKTIAMENMKNPTFDPDMKTLSTMDTEKSVDDNLDLLEQMYLDINATVNRLQQALVIRIRQPKSLRGNGRMVGGFISEADLNEEAHDLFVGNRDYTDDESAFFRGQNTGITY